MDEASKLLLEEKDKRIKQLEENVNAYNAELGHLKSANEKF